MRFPTRYRAQRICRTVHLAMPQNKIKPFVVMLKACVKNTDGQNFHDITVKKFIFNDN